jgi:hypothetical protein
MLKTGLSLVTLVVAIAAPAAAAPLCSAKSAAHTVALVELYTSEGCDSCPPADRWLRGLTREGITPDKAVALSLHVDYWDYIGWKDPYANPVFTARQKETSAINKATFVYTPQVLLSGRDFRRWQSGGLAAEVKRINAQPAGADIALEIHDAGAGRIEVRGGASLNASAGKPGDRADAQLVLALYENGLTSAVQAGENKGVTLQHDYVARDWNAPVTLGADGRAEAKLAVVLAGRNRGNSGAVAFVQNRKTGEVLQALALPMCAAIP